MIFSESIGSRASLSANKLKLSALRWAFFVQGRREPRSCKDLHGKSPKGRRPLSFNLFSAAPPRRRRGMWRTQCGKSRQHPIFEFRSQADLCGYEWICADESNEARFLRL